MEELAREIETALQHDFPNAKNLSFRPPATGGKGEVGKTVSADIDAVIAKLQTLIRGLEMLRGQL